MTDTAAPPPGNDALAAELHRVVGLADPVPDDWRAAAAGAFAWASIDAEPTRLEYDSRAVPAGRAVGGGPPAVATRAVRYVAGSAAIELELDVGADKVRVVGRVTPVRPVDVAVLWPEGRRDETTDEFGTFRVDDLPRRPLCVVVGGLQPVKSGWIVT